MHPLGWVGFLPPHCTLTPPSPPCSVLSVPLGSFFSLFLYLAGFKVFAHHQKLQSRVQPVPGRCQSRTGHHPEPSLRRAGRFPHHSTAAPAPGDPSMPWKPEREAPGSKTKASHRGVLQDAPCPACHLPGPAGAARAARGQGGRAPAAPRRPRSSGSPAGREGRGELGEGVEWEKRGGSPCVGTSGPQHRQSPEQEKGKMTLIR